MGRKRLYTLNESYFECIDSEDKAYWLGFIYADGYITKRKTGQHVLGITLHEKEPLELFCKCINTDKPVKQYISNSKYKPNSVEYKIVIISNKIVSDVEKLGVVPNKTFLLDTIPQMTEDLIHHFIRGYFDGDGSIFYHKQQGGYGGNKKYYYNILGVSICGTKKFLTTIKNQLPFIKDTDKILYKEKRLSSDTWTLKMFSNKRSINFYNYIYDNANYFLERKKFKFDEYFLLKDENQHIFI